MKPNPFIRMTALVLVPGLIGDPGFASSVGAGHRACPQSRRASHFHSIAGGDGAPPLQFLFTAQALAAEPEGAQRYTKRTFVAVMLTPLFVSRAFAGGQERRALLSTEDSSIPASPAAVKPGAIQGAEDLPPLPPGAHLPGDIDDPKLAEEERQFEREIRRALKMDRPEFADIRIFMKAPPPKKQPGKKPKAKSPEKELTGTLAVSASLVTPVRMVLIADVRRWRSAAPHAQDEREMLLRYYVRHEEFHLDFVLAHIEWITEVSIDVRRQFYPDQLLPEPVKKLVAHALQIQHDLRADDRAAEIFRPGQSNQRLSIVDLAVLYRRNREALFERVLGELTTCLAKTPEGRRRTKLRDELASWLKFPGELPPELVKQKNPLRLAKDVPPAAMQPAPATPAAKGPAGPVAHLSVDDVFGPSSIYENLRDPTPRIDKKHAVHIGGGNPAGPGAPSGGQETRYSSEDARKGIELFGKEMIFDALPFLVSAVLQAPRDLRVLWRLASAYSYMNLPNDAARAIGHAIRVLERDVPAPNRQGNVTVLHTYMTAARIYLKARDHESARSSAERAVEFLAETFSRRERAETLSLLGRIYIAQKMTSEARAQFERALSIHPGFLTAGHGLLSILVNLRDWRAARDLLEAFLPRALAKAGEPGISGELRELAGTIFELAALVYARLNRPNDAARWKAVAIGAAA